MIHRVPNGPHPLPVTPRTLLTATAGARLRRTGAGASLGLLLLLTPGLDAGLRPGALAARASSAEKPGGTPATVALEASPSVAALDQYLRGRGAWKEEYRAEAIEAWEHAASLDPSALPPRLALFRAQLLRDPSRSADAAQQVLGLFFRDFRAQRWLLANSILGLALAGTLAVLLIALGLVARHIRAAHHTLAEAFAVSLCPGRAAGVLSWITLALPCLVNAGILVTSLFWVFVCSFRFSRGERLLALAAAAWVVLLGVALPATEPLWCQSTSGHDALLIHEAQMAPSSPPSWSAVRTWLHEEPQNPVPLYLDGLARAETRDFSGALSALSRAAAAGHVPPVVIENQMGNIELRAGHTDRALTHYMRAKDLDPGAFEPHYNLGQALAARGDFLQADREIESAGRADLDQLRSLSRGQSGDGPRPPADAHWTDSDLWAWSLRHPSEEPVSRELGWFLPMGSPRWTGPVALASILLGLLTNLWLRRLVQVKVCYRCGGPVCRRCLVRLDRRAFCHSCADDFARKGGGDSTRLLINQLLTGRARWFTRSLRLASRLLPGTGALLRGFPAVGGAGAISMGLAATLLLYPLWGQPYLPGPWDSETPAVLQTMGVLLLFVALGWHALLLRAAERRNANLRTYLSRDVDRLAA